MEKLELYMMRAFDLANLGLGAVSPNPLVGAVIVHDHTIIGEGFHKKYGGPHAEVEAINAVKDPALLATSTLFVNLEPCAHVGKTPACADLIITTGIPRVVVANGDPNPKVAGQGFEKLRQAGVEVTTGVLEKPGAFLNRRFLTFIQQQRPYIVLKWAQTADGFIAKENYDSKWISNSQSRLLVHQYRAQEDAIMVGRGTAAYDNPKLTVRGWKGKNPLRIVLDPTLALPEDLNLFDGSTPTICYNYKKDDDTPNLSWVQLPKSGFLKNVFAELYNREMQSILIEGGGMLLTSLLESNQWDEARVFVSPNTFEKGIAAPRITQEYQEEQIISGDRLRIYQNNS